MDLPGAKEASSKTGRQKQAKSEAESQRIHHLCLGNLIKALPRNLENCFYPAHQLKNTSRPSHNVSQAKQDKYKLPDLSQMRITEVALKRTTAYRQTYQGASKTKMACIPPLECILRRRLYSKQQRESEFVSELKGRKDLAQVSGAKILKANILAQGHKLTFKSSRNSNPKLVFSARKCKDDAVWRDGEQTSGVKSKPRRGGAVFSIPKPKRKVQHLALPRIIVS